MAEIRTRLIVALVTIGVAFGGGMFTERQIGPRTSKLTIWPGGKITGPVSYRASNGCEFYLEKSGYAAADKTGGMSICTREAAVVVWGDDKPQPAAPTRAESAPRRDVDGAEGFRSWLDAYEFERRHAAASLRAPR